MKLQKYEKELGFELEFSIIENPGAEALRYGVQVVKRTNELEEETARVEGITESFNEALLLLHLLHAHCVTPISLADCLEYWYDYAASV